MRNYLRLIVILLLGAGLVQAQEAPPQRKSGLWDITRTSTRTGGAPRHLQLCVAQAGDNALRWLAEGVRDENCHVDKLTRSDTKLVVDAKCELRNVNSQTHAVITGTFDSAYRIESSSTYQPPLGVNDKGSAVLEAKWSGPCKADQRPGDLILANGKKVNIYEAAAPTKPAHGAAEAKKGKGRAPAAGQPGQMPQGKATLFPAAPSAPKIPPPPSNP